jgi:fluoroquinolone transport system permease protein
MRLRALIGVELLVQWRYGITVVFCGLAVCWTALLVVLRIPDVGPFLLFVETITAGTLIAGGLAAMDATTGASAAVRVSPARPVEVVLARLSTLSLLAAVSAVPVLIASGAVSRLPVALAAATLAALLLLALAMAVAARRSSFLGFLTSVAWPMVPLLVIPLGHAAGLLNGPGWYAVPTTGALALLRGASPYPAWAMITYLGAWCAAAGWLAVRATVAPARPGRGAARNARPLAGRCVRVRADVRNVSRDAVLAPIVASPLLLGLALRFGYPPLESWLDRTHGVDLVTYRPAVALVAVVLHVPVIFGMLGGLLLLDERDDGALRVIRVSPLGVRRHLAERLAAVTAATAAGLAVAAPLSGLVPATAWAAVVLAIPLGPLFTLAVLALASNRVQGLTAVKALGLPTYLPLAVLWLTGVTGWLFAPLPGFWAISAWHEPHPGWFGGGALCLTLWGLVLYPRVRGRL